MSVSQIGNLYRRWKSLNGEKETRITLAALTVSLLFAQIYNLMKDIAHYTVGDASSLVWIGFISRSLVLYAVVKLYLLFKNIDKK
jgi:hypothetical protein